MRIKSRFFWFGIFFFLTNCQNSNYESIKRARHTFDIILKFYYNPDNHLFNETYPADSDNTISYLVQEDSIEGKKVAYLWPTSGLFSGINALLRVTGNPEYEKLLREIIIPGLENYFDDKRQPACYQSYIIQCGESDRYYDDNIWLALDFLEAYCLTNDNSFLEKAKLLWKFILSGWDDTLGGGIYWCEQQKRSKNTCSNAPASVLGFKLFETTQDSSYLWWGMKIYEWTKANLQDTVDYLYFDNISVNGKIDKRKFTYNTGQMLQASALLYKLTREENYLKEAEIIAESAIQHFTEEFSTPDGRTIRLFKSFDNWFNVIMFRGYEELYGLNGKPRYIGIFQDNLDYLWNYVRDKDGLFKKAWTGENSGQFRWLLDQACMVEIFASISKYK